MKESSGRATLRKRTYEILEVAKPGDRLSRITDISLVTLITLNVIFIIFESMRTFAVQYEAQLIGFEIFSVTIFTVEYFARLWSCVEAEGAENTFGTRLRYALSPMALCDLIAILPSIIYVFVGMDMRFLRTLRLMRMFKFTRYSVAINLLLKVFKAESASFGATLFILLIVMVLASSGMYYVESEAQPEAFGSVPAAMWWAVATLTTVGYGDVTPITPWGKLFGACITIVGVGMIALPSGILASGFSEQLRRRRKEFEHHVGEVLDQGVITASEKRMLDNLREELGFTEEEAADILRDAAHRGQPRAPSNCPHCGKPLTEYAHKGVSE